jgi:hypothetical protein
MQHAAVVAQNGNQKQYPQRQKVKLVVDVPVTMQLEMIWNKKFPNNDGTVSYRFDVLVEEVPSSIYVPLAVRNAILKTGVQKGDWFELVMTRQNGETIYHAQLLSDAREPEPEPQPLPKHVPQPAVNFVKPQQSAQAQPQDYAETLQHPISRPQPSAQVQAPAPAQRSAAAQDTHPAQVSAYQVIEDQWFEALKISYNAWERLKRYAIEVGGTPVDYKSEDIRCFATSMRISHDRRNGHGGQS